MRDNGGSLTSIDLDISAATTVLTRHDLLEHVNLVQGHSIDVLSRYVADHQEKDRLDVCSWTGTTTRA